MIDRGSSTEVTKRDIVEFIAAMKGRGSFLAYSDLAYIDKWLSQVPPVELLFILDDLMERLEPTAAFWSLKFIDKRVSKAINHLNFRPNNHRDIDKNGIIPNK